MAARLQTQMWTLDPDPTNDTLGQLLRIGLWRRARWCSSAPAMSCFCLTAACAA